MNTRMMFVALLSMGLGVMNAPRSSAAGQIGEKASEESRETAIKIPDTVDGIWHEVTEHEAELGEIIASKKLERVHVAAFNIRDLVKALPGKSKDLAADKLAKLKVNVRFVDDLARRLDESGDANNQTSTETNFKSLQGILQTMKALYAPGK